MKKYLNTEKVFGKRKHYEIIGSSESCLTTNYITIENSKLCELSEKNKRIEL